jgi:hypothetical protein
MEFTIRAVTTPMKQARARKIRANWVLVATLMAYKLPEIKGKVKIKNFLAIKNLFW